MTATNNSALDKALARVYKALRTCQGTEERPQARRSARARSLSALRLVRAALDREFPSIVVRGTVTRLKTFNGRCARLERSGWRLINSYVSAGNFAAAGVRVQKIEHKDPDGSMHFAWFAPDWAVAIGPSDTAKLRAAKKSRKLKNVARTVAVLSE